jgi:hypothetical protein
MQKNSVFSDFYCLPDKLALMGPSPGLPGQTACRLRSISRKCQVHQLVGITSPVSPLLAWKDRLHYAVVIFSL